jgi:hypothetical protein
MAWFSQRKGFREVRKVIQIDEMDKNLRNGLWNALHTNLLLLEGFAYCDDRWKTPAIFAFATKFWGEFLKRPVDTRPGQSNDILHKIREMFFAWDWFEVYDFIEFTAVYYPELARLHNAINQALENDMGGYRLVGGKIVEITNTTEIECVDKALEQKDFPAAAKHLQRALEMLADRKTPDLRNSIKESISAVESAAKEITKLPKATLEDAIKLLEKNGELHACLKAGFSKLYAYTSDKGGIRHAMLDEPNLTKADALFFLVTCSAFINYLKSKI